MQQIFYYYVYLRSTVIKTLSFRVFSFYTKYCIVSRPKRILVRAVALIIYYIIYEEFFYKNFWVSAKCG